MRGDGKVRPMLSVCCLGYNHGRYLADTIASIAAIDYRPLEVIVVDDGSQDDSVLKLRQLADQMTFPMKVIAQENTGCIGLNFNRALAEAKGELVAFIALDDVYRADVMSAQIKDMLSQPQLVFSASSKIVNIDRNGYVLSASLTWSFENGEKPNLKQLLELEYSQFGAFYLQGMIIRKSYIQAISGFDEDMLGDDLVLRTKLFRYMLNQGIDQFQIIHENACFYRLHDANIHKNSFRQMKIVTEYWARYWPDRDVMPRLREWVFYLIKSVPASEMKDYLQHSPLASGLLKDHRIKAALFRKTVWESKLGRFLFSKERHNHVKVIKVLGIFRFVYGKKSISKKHGQHLHFQDYAKSHDAFGKI